MATTIRQMMRTAGVNDLSTYTILLQKGVGPWPMPGSQRLDTPGKTPPQGTVIPSTNAALDARITSAWDMPRVMIADSGGFNVYVPVCLSNQEPRFQFYTSSLNAYYGTGGAPIHILTDLQLEPWKGYQGPVVGPIGGNFPP